ncbi:MAG: MerR family transcriptional regulator [Ktedonobacteraceae bacterium]
MLPAHEQFQLPALSIESYTIEQAATRTGLTKRTLRYYEEVGLLAPANRTEGNYRRYSAADIERIERIKELRDLLDFSLNDIRALLEAEEEREQLKLANREETDALVRLARLERADELIQQQLSLVEQRITGLERMRKDLMDRLERHAHTKQQIIMAQK